MPVAKGPPTKPHVVGGLRSVAVAVTAFLLASIPLVLVIGALRDPTKSVHGMLGSALWTTLGPHFMLLSLLAFGLGFYAFRRWPRKITVLSLVLAGCASIGSTFITGTIIAATNMAGGKINPLSSLFLRSMTAGGPDETVAVATIDGRPLQAAIYRPALPQSAAPVLMYVHGGGFMTGSVTETDADLRWFADLGWLVVSVDYRLFPEGAPTWDLAPADVACGAAWLNSNAARLGGDIDRLAVLGDSAGGNLAINLAYAAARGDGETDCGEVPNASAVVVQYPAVDPLAIYAHGFPVRGFEPRMLVTGYLGGSPHALPDRVRAVSSYTYIHDRAPQTLILSPEQDGLVPAWSVIRFAEHAQQAGVDVELVRIPFANHVYNQIAANSLGNQARRSITVHYLTERGLAPGASH